MIGEMPVSRGVYPLSFGAVEPTVSTCLSGPKNPRIRRHAGLLRACCLRTGANEMPASSDFLAELRTQQRSRDDSANVRNVRRCGCYPPESRDGEA